MGLLTRYDTPAFLPDFNAIPGQLDAWSRAISAWFDQIISNDGAKFGGFPLQYYNGMNFDPGGIAVEQAVTWNAFPKELQRRYGRERAFVLADRLWPVERYNHPSPDPDDTTGTSGVLYRPQEEYCEWHVLRDQDSGRIQRVTFSSEPPEYWQAFAGLVPGSMDPPIADQQFPGDRNALLALYRTLVSRDVQMDDLFPAQDTLDKEGNVIVASGVYNIYNKWNTTDGIAHLNSPPNSLVAEIQLGADASIRYTDPQGRLLVEPDALIAYARYGGPNRNSDPTIGSTMNALARIGAYVTLRNPVGLYMDHIDLSGWRAPDGGGVTDCVRVVRGLPDMIERLVVEVPASRGFVVSDITIAGTPIRYGGQIAECITVKLVGVAHIAAVAAERSAVPGKAIGIIDPAWPRVVGSIPSNSVPPGYLQAYLGQGGAEIAPVPAALTTAALRAPSPAAYPGPVTRVKRRFSSTRA